MDGPAGSPDRDIDGRPTSVAIVVADGDLEPSTLAALVRSEPGAIVIAADGGAEKVLSAGLRPDLVIGDGDSLAAADRAHLEDLGVPVRLALVEKDESDTELCLLAALEAGARGIRLVGALGGARPEHSVANLLLIVDGRFDGVDLVMIEGASRLMRLGTADGEGRLDITGRRGDFVSLFALGGDVSGVRTDGLRYALHDETLLPGPARGLSNEMLGEHAGVTTRRGRLLVVHTPRVDPGERAMAR